MQNEKIIKVAVFKNKNNDHIIRKIFLKWSVIKLEFFHEARVLLLCLVFVSIT